MPKMREAPWPGRAGSSSNSSAWLVVTEVDGGCMVGWLVGCLVAWLVGGTIGGWLDDSVRLPG